MSYASIVIEGGLFPPDLLDRIATGELPGQSAADFGLDGRRILSELQASFSAARTYWEGFHQRRLHSRESLTTLTRQAWVEPLFELLGFQLERQRAGLVAGGESFVISHTAGRDPLAPPVHVVEYERSLDSRDGRRSPHSAVQEYLNRSDAVWGIVTNGAKLRLLRDSSRISHPVFVEFDIRAMIDGNLYSEFVVLYRLLHATRFPKGATDAHDCLLSKYYETGIDEGSRVREHLRDGVESALERLGTTFLSHPANDDLRAAFADGRLDEQGYYRELLRLIYRLLFLAVAEERHLLFPPESPLTAQSTYDRYYSLSALRDRADRRGGRDSHTDLWEGLCQTFRLFREDALAGKLGLHALNGELFGDAACREIEAARCANRDLLDAVHALSMFEDKKAKLWRHVNYAALDVEELGSVYESLLDFQPHVSRDPWRFEFITGTERKTTGSYYTPPELVHELIQSALVPVIEDRIAGKRTKEEKEAALLALRVIDPASGSGHFMLAAARRIARELARVRSGEDEPSPGDYRHALRDVIRSCIYAVDRNPLAADLCKVALWIEGHNAGLPLSFLDNHVKCGDSLVGVFDLDVLRTGIPDDAYTPVSGDDRAIATALKNRNKTERAGQLQLGFDPGLPAKDLASDFEVFAEMDESTPADVHAKEEIYQQIRGSGSKWWQWKVTCDLWTAAFFTPLTAAAQAMVPTTATVRGHLVAPKASNGQAVGNAVGLSGTNLFLHWPLEFPEVFANGGFDAVLGNPPWERIKLQELEFFAKRDLDVALAPNAAVRKELIRTLARRKPAIAAEFEAAKYTAEAQSRFVRNGGRFPLCGRGDINTYSVFAELMRGLIGPSGRAGFIVPSGIATDNTTKYFLASLVEHSSIVSFFEFENDGFFSAGKGHMVRFALTTLVGRGVANTKATFMFQGSAVEELQDPDRRFSLSANDFGLLNPNTRTCPIFRTSRDAEITKAIYRRVPILVREGPPEVNPWAVRFATLFHMSNDSDLFWYQDDLEAEGWRLEGNVFRKPGEEHPYLPLYESKMVYQFEHRHGDHGLLIPGDGGHVLPEPPDRLRADPSYANLPRYWVPEVEVQTRLADKWDRDWLLGFRDVTDARASVRTVVASVIPRVGVGNNLPLVLVGQDHRNLAGHLVGNLCSFALDFAARSKVGGLHLNFFIFEQLPVLAPATYQETTPWYADLSVREWIGERVLELTYTAWDLQPFARDLGYEGAPFRWDPERRFLLRCELDAAYFHLYGISHDDADYVMDTFPIVRRRDEAACGEYRTKRVILEIYDELSRAASTGHPYQTRLDPPPADPRVAHPSEPGPDLVYNPRGRE